MSIYHLSVKIVRRADKRTAHAASAYRRGIRLTDRNGVAHDYQKRHGVVWTGIAAPDGCDWALDAQRLWDRSEAAERRKDSRVAREFEIALPHEVDGAARIGLTQRFAEHLVDRFGIGVDVAIHAPSGDSKNHHAHLLTTTRALTPGGPGEKIRELDLKTTSPALIEEIRATWAAMCNEALAREGRPERVDHRSRVRQKILPNAAVYVSRVDIALSERSIVTERVARFKDRRREHQLRMTALRRFLAQQKNVPLTAEARLRASLDTTNPFKNMEFHDGRSTPNFSMRPL